jgi:hypothetical protein
VGGKNYSNYRKFATIVNTERKRRELQQPGNPSCGPFYRTKR